MYGIHTPYLAYRNYAFKLHEIWRFPSYSNWRKNNIFSRYTLQSLERRVSMYSGHTLCSTDKVVWSILISGQLLGVSLNNFDGMTLMGLNIIWEGNLSRTVIAYMLHIILVLCLPRSNLSRLRGATCEL